MMIMLLSSPQPTTHDGQTEERRHTSTTKRRRGRRDDDRGKEETKTSLAHPVGCAEGGAGVDGNAGGGGELFFDAEELVVFGGAFAAAGGAGFDLAGAEADGDVGDEGVFGFAGAVGSHDAPAVGLGELDGVDGLRESADLVDFEEERVAGVVGDGALDAFGIRHREVVADDLDLVADALDQRRPGLPVVLVEGVLDRDDGEVGAEVGVVVRQFGRRQLQLFRFLGAVFVRVEEAEVVAVLAGHFKF
mmetsp:Transcript_12165/g.36664  ORF Transcript_12165/g.36664 Transcript_12165/m.36664 type:complete len:247 (+) Transcript_12165:149-889(+)